ncbi:hypothetical protein AM587_10000687 [Phytophthora nicotianae]|uniref:Uncharacterized protein n=1 Tax=Phytophthora nicotianae TaxID=4792 RepID=A0A0W8DVE6_PHYNI|nr:hypothetical protein AM587_10000687 [Phytophthora nicotianae]
MDAECKFVRIEMFLGNISTLHHVLESIDEMLMSPEEALINAAATNQFQWIEQLLGSSNGDLRDAISSAAANGHVDMILYLVHKIGEREKQTANERDGSEDESDDDCADEEIANTP